MITISGIISGMIGAIILNMIIFLVIKIELYFKTTEYCPECGSNSFKKIFIDPHNRGRECQRCKKVSHFFGMANRKYTTRKIPTDLKEICTLKLNYHLKKLFKVKKLQNKTQS